MRPYKSAFIIIALLFLATTAASTATSMRCGNDLVNIGDRAFLVIQKCGEPISKQIIGYTIDENKNRELTIEEWVYGPRNRYYYFITFVGGRVSNISSERL